MKIEHNIEIVIPIFQWNSPHKSLILGIGTQRGRRKWKQKGKLIKQKQRIQENIKKLIYTK